MGLIEDARAAKDAGLSYGEYMLKREFIPYKKPEGKRCEVCGFLLKKYQQRFCSARCRGESNLRKSRGDVFV